MSNATTALMDCIERSPNVLRDYFLFAAPGLPEYDLVTLWQKAKLSLGKRGAPDEQMEIAANDALAIVKALCHYWASDGMAVDILGSWKEYETLIYFSSREYRDHFLHQFYVFLLGISLLGHQLIVRNQMRISLDSLKKEWQGSGDPRYNESPGPAKYGDTCWVWNDPLFFDQKLSARLFRRWLLASCFHDLGYPAETLARLSTALGEKFFAKVPGYDIFPLRLKTSEHLERSLSPILERLGLLLLYDEWLPLNFTLPPEETSRSLAPIVGIFRTGLEQKDHGVMSAVFFLLTMLGDLQELPVNVAIQDAILEDVYVAALAMALHNLRQTIYPSIVVNFRSHPIAFMLMLCDELQEWDRTPSNTEFWDNFASVGVSTMGHGESTLACSPYLWDLDFRFRPGTPPPSPPQKARFWHHLSGLVRNNLAGGPALRVGVDGQLFFEAHSLMLPIKHWSEIIRPHPNPDYFIRGEHNCPNKDYCKACKKERRQL